MTRPVGGERMKLYKLWIDIEEHDVEMNEYRSLCDEGGLAPVPIAEFTELEAAIEFAEALGMDRPIKDVERFCDCN